MMHEDDAAHLYVELLFIVGLGAAAVVAIVRAVF